MLFCWHISAEQHRPYIYIPGEQHRPYIQPNRLTSLYTAESSTASSMYIFQQNSISLEVATPGSCDPWARRPREWQPVTMTRQSLCRFVEYLGVVRPVSN